MENIKDSLELASGTDIAEYEDGNVTVKLVVNGEVSLDYKGEIYNNVNDFPEELKTIIHEGNTFSHDDVDVLSNNWFELEVFANGEYIGDFFGDTDAVFEAEGLSSSIIEETMQNYAEEAKDYLKEQEQQYESGY